MLKAFEDKTQNPGKCSNETRIKQENCRECQHCNEIVIADKD